MIRRALIAVLKSRQRVLRETLAMLEREKRSHEAPARRRVRNRLESVERRLRELGA